MTKDEEIKEHLLASNPDFRRLAEEHRNYEVKLSELHDRPRVTAEEEFEEVNLKKRKLHLKDQMSRMIHEYRQDQMSHQSS